MRSLLGTNRADFVAAYPFDITPATDDRPYFFQFFRWSSLPKVLRLRDVGGLSFFEWGYPVLVMTLLQAVLASAVLIVTPLVLNADRRRAMSEVGGWVVGYFGLLGFAFMFVEMAFIARLTLFLHHPVHAAAAVLSSMLVFAGLGSHVSARLAERFGPARVIRDAALLLVGLILAYVTVLPALFTACLGWPLAGRFLLALLVLAPMALLMGMPLPLGLTQLTRIQVNAVPWAWCVNGCASVVSAVGGTLAAVHLGFSTVVVAAALAYAVVARMGYRR